MTTPLFLSQFVRNLVIMSISGGLITFLLLLIKPIIRHRLPKSAQYYLWLVVLAALLVPVSQIASMPANLPNLSPIPAAVERNVITVWEETERVISQHNSPLASNPPVDIYGLASPSIPTEPAAFEPPHIPNALFVMATTILMLTYPWVAALILLYSLVSYTRFVNKMRRHYVPANLDEADLLTELTKGKKAPRLFRCSLAATPMLIGLFKPIILLPNKEYAQNQIHSILLHELTHMRRRDIAVKWLFLLACALHWFNPAAWFARREISRACELSCDEIVIRNMDAWDKQNYGDTLISVAADTKLPAPVLSTTMCEEKRALKERLAAIMKSKKHTKFAIFISVLVILAASVTACALGAGGSRAEDESNPQTPYEFARQYIDELTQGLFVGIFDPADQFMHLYVRPANIIDARINSFELLAYFDHFLSQTVELWRLDFALQTDDFEGPSLRWGTFSHDADGWVGAHTGWNDADSIMIFTHSDSGLEFLGTMGWWMQQHTAWKERDEPWALDIALRTFLEYEGLLPAVSFPGGHHIAYVRFGADIYIRFLLSQPLGGNPWVVERWQHIFDGGATLGQIGRASTLPEILTEFNRLDPVEALTYFLENNPMMRHFVQLGYEITNIHPLSPSDDPLAGPVEFSRPRTPSAGLLFNHSFLDIASTSVYDVTRVYYVRTDTVLTPLHDGIFADIFKVSRLPARGNLGNIFYLPGWDERERVQPAATGQFLLTPGFYVVFASEVMDDFFIIVVGQENFPHAHDVVEFTLRIPDPDGPTIILEADIDLLHFQINTLGHSTGELYVAHSSSLSPNPHLPMGRSVTIEWENRGPIPNIGISFGTNEHAFVRHFMFRQGEDGRVELVEFSPAMPPRWVGWPAPFDDAHYLELRAQVLSQIGGLAYNEAYQFQMDDGRFMLITGWRPFTTRAELVRYYPHLDLPQQIGDFSLIQITVNDRLQNGVLIYTNPIHETLHGFVSGNSRNLLPVGEIFTRGLLAHSIYAVYANSQNEFAGLGISTYVMISVPEVLVAIAPHLLTTVDMGQFGQIHFVGEIEDTNISDTWALHFAGEEGMYNAAMYDPADAWFIIELHHLAHPSQAPELWPSHVTTTIGSPVPRASLESIVRIFNPPALAEQFNWRLDPLQ